MEVRRSMTTKAFQIYGKINLPPKQMHPHCRSLISHQPRSTSSDIWVLHIRTDYRHRFRYLLRIINILIVHLCRHTLHNFRLVVMLSPLNNSITSIVSMLTEFNLPGNCTVYCHYQHISCNQTESQFTIILTAILHFTFSYLDKFFCFLLIFSSSFFIFLIHIIWIPIAICFLSVYTDFISITIDGLCGSILVIIRKYKKATKTWCEIDHGRSIFIFSNNLLSISDIDS